MRIPGLLSFEKLNFARFYTRERNMNEKINDGVCCDVCSCEHNSNGTKCKLGTIKITKDCTNCTCCESFKNREL